MKKGILLIEELKDEPIFKTIKIDEGEIKNDKKTQEEDYDRK